MRLRGTKCIPISIFVGIVALVAALFYAQARNVPIPRRFKLADVNSAEVAGRLTLPKGHHFELVLGFPRGHTCDSEQFRGEYSIVQQDRTIARSSFSRRSASRCNWLQRDGLDEAYIITWNAKANRYDGRNTLQQEQAYVFRVTFEPPAPVGASLWLSCLQGWKDFPGDDAEKAAERHRMGLGNE